MKKLEKILTSMKDDIAYINQQLAIHEKKCIAEDLPLGDDWHDVNRRMVKVMLDLMTL